MTQMGNLERKQQVLHRESMLLLQRISKKVATTENDSSSFYASRSHCLFSA